MSTRKATVSTEDRATSVAEKAFIARVMLEAVFYGVAFQTSKLEAAPNDPHHHPKVGLSD